MSVRKSASCSVKRLGREVADGLKLCWYLLTNNFEKVEQHAYEGHVIVDGKRVELSAEETKAIMAPVSELLISKQPLAAKLSAFDVACHKSNVALNEVLKNKR